MLYAISDDGHRIYHMLIRHGLRFGCIIIIGVYSDAHAHGTLHMLRACYVIYEKYTQMEEERSSHDSPTNECARIQWCIRVNPGPDSSKECCRGDTLRSFLANVGQMSMSFAQAPIPVISIGIVRGVFPLAMGVASDAA